MGICIFCQSIGKVLLFFLFFFVGGAFQLAFYANFAHSKVFGVPWCIIVSDSLMTLVARERKLRHWNKSWSIANKFSRANFHYRFGRLVTSCARHAKNLTINTRLDETLANTALNTSSNQSWNPTFQYHNWNYLKAISAIFLYLN